MSRAVQLCVVLKEDQAVPLVKNPPANAGDAGDKDLIPGWGRSPGGAHGNPLQYSSLENPMDRGAQQARVHRVAKTEATEHKHICLDLRFLSPFPPPSTKFIIQEIDIPLKRSLSSSFLKF